MSSFLKEFVQSINEEHRKVGDDILAEVLYVAWTGIVANLLPAGRTVNSAFKLIVANQNRSSSVKRQQKEARMLMETEAIIWDEISMASKGAFEAVDSLLRDLMQNDRPFCGKLIIVGGDFRQTLPIVEHGGRNEVVETCVNRSALWRLFTKYRLTTNMRAQNAGDTWPEFLLKVGSGEANDADDRVMIAHNCIYEGDIVTSVFEEVIDPESAYNFAEKAVLAPKNSHVHALNADTLRRLQVENERDERVFKSVDEGIIEDNTDQLYMPTEHAYMPT
ncbi:unnamed protein product [Heligmosomoides polygyrus]|uniref:ATP-dependent DNA helicase n=1 Tax=Heligmosomoides polygyrus TaxID=6339 RepID=A0A3P8FU93_HELPZ|nr:unnamed protein product [Heligmosomoides polygyrus]